MSSDRNFPQDTSANDPSGAASNPQAQHPSPALGAASTSVPTSASASASPSSSPAFSGRDSIGATAAGYTSGAVNAGAVNAGAANGANGDGAKIGGDGGGELQKRALMDHLVASLARDAVVPEERPSGSRMAHFMGVLRRRWLPMLLVFLVTLPLITWKLKPGVTTYIADTRMLLPSGTSDAVDPSGILSGIKIGGSSKVDTQIAIITSPMMVARAVKSLPKPMQPRAAAVGINAAASVSPDIIDISASSGDSQASVKMANAMVQAYADYTRGQSSESDVKSVEFLGQQLKKAKSALVNAKLALQRYKERYQIFNIDRALESSTTSIETLTQKVAEARTDVAAGPAGSTVQGDATATNLQQKALDARLNLEDVLREYTESSPEAQRARRRQIDAQQQADRRIAALTQTAQERLRALEASLSTAQSRAAVLPSLEFKLSQLQDDAGATAASYRTLSDKYNTLRISSSAKTAVPRVLTPATGAREIVPTWMRPILLGTLAALVLSSLLAAILEQMDNTLHSTEDLEPLLRTSLLGTMPLLRGRKERRLTHLKNPSLEAPVLLEACRILRSNLTFASVDAPLRSVLVTSADPGEGKSLSALNLAAVMAMDGRRVVLLDCDLRRPTQHLLSEVVPEPGFSNILTGESTLEEALRPTSLANLSLVPAGTLPPNPPELLGSEHGRQLLRDLRERFDLVVIDSPPVLSLADPQVLCSMVDGVVLVVAANSTSKEHLQRAQGILRHAGGRLLGVVFNKVLERNDIHNTNNYYTYSTLDNNNRGIAGLLKRR